MDLAKFISEIEEQTTNASKPQVLSDMPSSIVCDAAPLTARWLEYSAMPLRRPQDMERFQQVQSIAREHGAFTQSEGTRDEIQNMQSILAQLSRLAETGVVPTTELELMLSKIKSGSAILNEAVYKRQQFMVATKDYARLPDKMADEIIRYLTRRRLAAQ